MLNLRNKKYIVVFLIKEQNTYNMIHRKKFKPSDKVVRFRKQSIPISSSLPTYSIGLKLFFFIDITSNTQLFFKSSKNNTINAKVIDMILQESIITQLTSNLTSTSKFTMNLIYIVLYIIFGVLIGFIIGQYISFPLPNQVPTVPIT